MDDVRSAQMPAQAHAWFNYHHSELEDRAYRQFRRLPYHDRYDAVAETLGQIFQYAVRAEQRGQLDRLTPPALVEYFSSLTWSERRLAGSCTTDVLSRASQRKHGYRAISLDQPRPIKTWHGHTVMSLSMMLANEKAELPDENARLNLDYPEILDRENATIRERRLFRYLCETHGEGEQGDLAREFRVNPAQLTRSKRKLASYLTKYDYLPPPTRPIRTNSSGRL